MKLKYRLKDLLIIVLLVSSTLPGYSQQISLLELENFVEMRTIELNTYLDDKNYKDRGEVDSMGTVYAVRSNSFGRVQYSQDKAGAGEVATVLYSTNDFNSYLEIKNKLKWRGYIKTDSTSHGAIKSTNYGTHKYELELGHYTLIRTGATMYFVMIRRREY
ncbi:hypothetical protein COB64_03775 [Candidatus Wolfebacteria bacterium]|nr:MAG: hypothetical protein COB64_03775 [Candidatus Wolfebacteria bacterium]